MLLRFAHYALLLMLFGGMAFRLFELRRFDNVQLSPLLVRMAALAAPVVTIWLMLVVWRR